MKIIKKTLIAMIICIMLLFVEITISNKINANATWETISFESTNLGYGVTLDKYYGESTSSFNQTTQKDGRTQYIYTANVPADSKAKVVQWSIAGVENSWGSRTLENIAKNYEEKHPNEKVLIATNNWLSDTQANNRGELDGVQISDGISYRVSDKQGTIDNPTFAHGYIPRDNFLGFDASGKTAYFTDDWNNGANYTDYLALSFYNGSDEERNDLNIKIDKINEEPAEGELAIYFKNYNGNKISFDNATIYQMKGKTIIHDNAPQTDGGVERDICAMGSFVNKVDKLDFDWSTAFPYVYYFVSKNKTFDELDLTDKTLLAQYELLNEFTNVVGATTYYCRIVRDGETYPGSFGNWNEINCEVHPRTVFVIKEDGSFALSVIDGRQTGMNGMDYEDMANFYKTMYNGYNVFNYDGGGSSCMIVRNQKNSFDIVNSPSDGHERLVTNATMVVVEKEPFTISQENICYNKIEMQLTDVDDNVENIYAFINGEKKTFVDNKVTFKNPDPNSTYNAQISYKLKNDEKEIIATNFMVRTSDVPPTIDYYYFRAIKQTSFKIDLTINNNHNNFYQAIIEVNNKKYYITDLDSITEITDLTYNKTYEVVITVVSLNGTKDMYQEEFIYSVKTADLTTSDNFTIKINQEYLLVNEETDLEINYKPVKASTTLSYSSSNEEVIVISEEGKIKALKEGTSTITVVSTEGLMATVDIKVLTYPPLETIAISLPVDTIKVGETIQATCTLTPTKANPKVTYTSSNEEVATVNEEGLITGCSKGKSIITVTASDGTESVVVINVEKGKGCQKKTLSELIILTLTCSIIIYLIRKKK